MTDYTRLHLLLETAALLRSHGQTYQSLINKIMTEIGEINKGSQEPVPPPAQWGKAVPVEATIVEPELDYDDTTVGRR